MESEETAKSPKELFRERFAADRTDRSLTQEDWGKAAENLRRISPYAGARNVLVSPNPVLRQACLNLLNDRKRLYLPTPGLQHGFVRIDPEVIPPRKRRLAIQLKIKDPSLGKIPYDVPLEEPIDMIVTESLAVTHDGRRMGDGQGFLDLQATILHALGWADSAMRVVTLVREDQLVDSLPTENTDVGVHWIVTPKQALETHYHAPPRREILWERLSVKTIRRNDALFHLYRKSGNAPLQSRANLGNKPKKT